MAAPWLTALLLLLSRALMGSEFALVIANGNVTFYTSHCFPEPSEGF